eukprot:Pgem_evm1s15704
MKRNNTLPSKRFIERIDESETKLAVYHENNNDGLFISLESMYDGGVPNGNDNEDSNCKVVFNTDKVNDDNKSDTESITSKSSRSSKKSRKVKEMFQKKKKTNTNNVKPTTEPVFV